MNKRLTGVHFAEADEDVPMAYMDDTPEVVTGNAVSCRVKGTWLMHWGQETFDFVDGKRVKIPRDLYGYLKSRGNIYDTL